MSKYRKLIPALIWCALIWTASSVPAEDIPTVNILGIDKLAHLGVYAVLGILINYGLRQFKLHWSQRLILFAMLVLLATADEFHQTYIPGRSVSAYDQIANVLGLSLGLLVKRRKA